MEAQFREHFAIAHQTPTYAMLLAAAPVEFVGSAARLGALVELMSVGVAAAFQDQGLPLPPWRRARSVLSKWALGQDGHGENVHSICRKRYPLGERSCTPLPCLKVTSVKDIMGRARSCPHSCVANCPETPCMPGGFKILRNSLHA